MPREFILPGIEGTYITDYGTDQSNDLENPYLVLYEAYHYGETFTPSSEEILNYIRTHFNDSNNFVEELGKIQEGYGDPLITRL